jgi:uncharacterized protein
MKQQKKLHLTWSTVHADAKKIVRKVQKSTFKPDWIIGITTGGLFPLAYVAKGLKTRSVSTITASSYNEKNQRGSLSIHALPHIELKGKHILLIDEIADSGETLRIIKETLIKKQRAASVITAVLCMRSDHCTTKPDIYARAVTQWVVFPWDK